MSRLGKMPNWQRAFVISGIFACSVSGLLYLIGHEFQIQRHTFGSRHILITHGIAAMFATLALGSILPFHLKAGYKSKRKWLSGFSQLIFLVALMVSGALLYYGPEAIRDEVIFAHWIVGLLFFSIFMLHVFQKIREANKRM